jgi:hypothetical protein
MLLNPFAFGSGVVVPGDDWQIIAHKAVPVDSIFDFAGLDLTEYQRIVIMINGLRADTEDVTVWLHASAGGSPILSGYRYTITPVLSSDATAGTASASASATGILLALAADTQTNYSMGMRVEFTNATSALHKIFCLDGTRSNQAGDVVRSWGGGIVESTTAIDGFVVSAEGGLLTAGLVTIYGVKLGARTGSPITPEMMSMWVGALT